MCIDPATGLALTQLAIGTAAQASTASAQTAAITRQRDGQVADSMRQRDQQYRQAAQAATEEGRRAQQAAALFDTVGAEYGGGVSVDRGRASDRILQGERFATLGSNASDAFSENSFQTSAIKDRAAGQLANVSRPSFLGTALQIGGIAYNDSQLRPKIKDLFKP